MSQLPPENNDILAQMPGLSEPELDRVRRLVAMGGTSYLSPDKESGPFMLFLLGDDVETVSQKTQIPKDVILLTAANYRWVEKRNILHQKGTREDLIKGIEKDMLNNILVATYQSVTQDVGAVMAGKMKAEDCAFIPKSMQALQKLMEMVEKVNNLVPIQQPSKDSENRTIIHAENVQINNDGSTSFDEKRREFLKALAAQNL